MSVFHFVYLLTEKNIFKVDLCGITKSVSVEKYKKDLSNCKICSPTHLILAKKGLLIIYITYSSRQISVMNDDR